MAKYTLDETQVEERIKRFLNIPPNDIVYSNCHGSAKCLIGFGDPINPIRPVETSREDMILFLKDNCEQVKAARKYDLATFWSNFPIEGLKENESRLLHSSIIIEPETEKIFHQIDTWGDFEFSTIDKFISKYFPKKFQRDKEVLMRYYRIQ